MILNLDNFSFLSKGDFRVLLAIEIGMKNHEYLPVNLIASLADLRKEGLIKVINTLLKYKLIVHNNEKYDGYKLSYLGYDYLALKAFMKRGSIASVGCQIGVGKESDIYVCKDKNGSFVCLKIHRLGRLSFRAIKSKRDYYGNKKFRNWLYLSRIAATKEFTFLKALYENGFPVPIPFDYNRHMIVMSYIDGSPLASVKLKHPCKVIDMLISTLLRLAKADIVHGDFNEFNILVDENENVTIIDFPQVVSLRHATGKLYFDRDLQCIKSYFYKKYKIDIVDVPTYEELIKEEMDETFICDRPNVTEKENKMLMNILQLDRSDKNVMSGEDESNESIVNSDNDSNASHDILEEDSRSNETNEMNERSGNSASTNCVTEECIDEKELCYPLENEDRYIQESDQEFFSFEPNEYTLDSIEIEACMASNGQSSQYEREAGDLVQNKRIQDQQFFKMYHEEMDRQNTCIMYGIEERGREGKHEEHYTSYMDNEEIEFKIKEYEEYCNNDKFGNFTNEDYKRVIENAKEFDKIIQEMREQEEMNYEKREDGVEEYSCERSIENRSYIESDGESECESIEMRTPLAHFTKGEVEESDVVESERDMTEEGIAKKKECAWVDEVIDEMKRTPIGFKNLRDTNEKELFEKPNENKDLDIENKNHFYDGSNTSYEDNKDDLNYDISENSKIGYKIDNESQEEEEEEYDEEGEDDENDDDDEEEEGTEEEETVQKLSHVYKPTCKRMSKEYAHTAIKYMNKKKKNKNKYRENLRASTKKKQMEKIKDFF